MRSRFEVTNNGDGDKNNVRRLEICVNYSVRSIRDSNRERILRCRNYVSTRTIAVAGLAVRPLKKRTREFFSSGVRDRVSRLHVQFGRGPGAANFDIGGLGLLVCRTTRVSLQQQQLSIAVVVDVQSYIIRVCRSRASRDLVRMYECEWRGIKCGFTPARILRFKIKWLL